MNADLLKSYLKYSYKHILVIFAFLLLLSYLDNFSYLYFIFLPITFVRDYFQFDNRQIKIKKLKAKGLTEEDIINIQFVKKWEEVREKGIWKYCITDGGIILGAYLWLTISILAIATSVVKFKALVDAPGNMFGFIGYTYIAGAIIGVISHRVLWIYNQRRFIKLTDPLNDKYQQKLFQDQ